MGILKLTSPWRTPITKIQRRHTKSRKRTLIGISLRIFLGHAHSLSFMSPIGVKSERLFFKSSFPCFFSIAPLEANKTSPLSSEMIMQSPSETSVMPTPARCRVPHSLGREVDLDRGRREIGRASCRERV